MLLSHDCLTHWGRVTHICVGNLTIIGSDNGLSPDRCQAIIWTNAELLLIGPLGTNFSEILIEILTFSFQKMRLKVSFAKWRPFCLGLNVSNNSGDKLSHTNSLISQPSAVNQVAVAPIVISTNTCCVWTMYLCMHSVTFVLGAPGAKILTGVFLFSGTLLMCDNLQTLFGCFY